MEKIICYDTLFEACIENINEKEAHIPDYYPEVFKIVRTQALPLICKTTREQEKTLLEGNIIYTILYIPSDGKGLCSFSTKVPFSCSFDFSEDGLYLPSLKTQYASCKLISGRKAALKGVIAVTLKVLGKRECEYYLPKENNIIALKKQVEVSSPIATGQKLFKINQEVEVNLPVGAPLYTTATPIIKETKLIKGKAIVKGEINTKTLVVTKEDKIKEQCFIFPFSQIIDVPEAEENDKALSYIDICDIDQMLSLSHKENCSILEYDITAQISLLIIRDLKKELCTDCFSTDYETNLKKQPCLFRKAQTNIEGSFKAGGKVGFTGGFTNILDCIGEVRVDTATHSGRLLRLSGSIDIKILYENSQEEILSLEKTLPFQGEFATEELTDISVWAKCHIQSYHITALGENQGQVDLTLFMQAVLFKSQSISYITALNLAKENPKEKSALPPLSIYFAKKGENIWDIAKSFNISPERIKELNLCDDTLSEDKKLLLPRLYP